MTSTKIRVLRVALIALARAQAGEQFQFSSGTYEFESTRAAFDLLTGSSAAREALLSGARANDVVELVAPVEPSWKDVVKEAETRADFAAT